MHKNKFWSFKAVSPTTGELTLYGEISDASWWGDEITPKTFKEDLDALGDINHLNIYINSPGGDVFAGETIISILKRHKAHKVVYIDGLAASMAAAVAMVGDRIIIAQNGMMMIHNPWIYVSGDANHLRRTADLLDKLREGTIDTFSSKSNLSRENLVEMLDAETWLSAAECLKYGFVHEISEAKRIAALVSAEVLSRYKNVPEHLHEAPEPDNDQVDELTKQKILIELEL